MNRQRSNDPLRLEETHSSQTNSISDGELKESQNDRGQGQTLTETLASSDTNSISSYATQSSNEDDEEAFLRRTPPGVVDIDESIERFLETDEYYSKEHEGDGLCLLSRYGPSHLSPERAAELLPPSKDGLIWHATVVADTGSVPVRDWDPVNNCIKPRRSSLMVMADDFFSSLIQTNENPPRWLFSGVLNGWPSFVLFEVQSITVSISGTRVPSIKRGIDRLIFRTWSHSKHGVKGIAPSFPKEKVPIVKHKEVRVRLRAPDWTSQGWSKDSPGFVWWYEAQKNTPRVLHGEDMIREPQSLREPDPICTRVHMFSHRYAIGTKKENPKEIFTYHSAILLEWDHQKFCTVVELAYLNGLSGYSGRSNFFHDKNELPTMLYKTLPRRMVAPWSWSHAEIRCLDVEARSIAEFKEFIWQYAGHEHRFVDPRFTHSHDVRLTFRAKSHICRYLLNYMGRDRRYSEVFRNCQTFAADFFGFLAGKKGIEPFTYWNRIDYTNRSHLFLYDHENYSTWT